MISCPTFYSYCKSSTYLTIIHAVFCALSLRSLPPKSLKIIPGSESRYWVSCDVDVGGHLNSVLGKVKPMVMFEQKIFSAIEFFDFFRDVFCDFLLAVWPVNLAVRFGIAADAVLGINAPTLVVQGELVALGKT